MEDLTITIFLSPLGFQMYPVLILYIVYMSTTGVPSVYQAFSAE